MKIKILFLAVFSFAICFAKAQSISVSGCIFSYNSEKVALLKKARKNVSFDGSLENATISLTGNGTTQNVKTGLNGIFTVKLAEPGSYKLSVTRNGYSSISLELIYEDAGSRNRFESLFLILKKEEEAEEIKLGTLTINHGGEYIFFANEKEKNNNDLYLSNTHLIERSVLINKAGNTKAVLNVEPKKQESKTPIKKEISTKDTSINVKNKIARNNVSWTNLNLEDLKNHLNDAKNQLKNLDSSSDEYAALQLQIILAEQKIKDKESIIALQENEISQSKKIIIYLSLFGVVVVFCLALLFYFFRTKKKFAADLAVKNDKITRINNKLLSSIRYASVIQNGFLQNKSDLQKIFKESFIYNQPKDILSGDFYWFSNKNGQRILVVADCTGHGVPGAMLTVLGHSALEDLAKTQTEITPSKIIGELNKVFQLTFSSNPDYLEYGVDLTAISIKDGSNEVLYSGLGNGLYLHTKKGIRFCPVTPKSLGPDLTADDIKDQKIVVEKGDQLFLFTDGYIDQFKGNTKEIIKFNLNKFEKLLVDASGKNDFNAMDKTLEKTFNEWKADRDQVDDVCVAGIKI